MCDKSHGEFLTRTNGDLDHRTTSEELVTISLVCCMAPSNPQEPSSTAPEFLADPELIAEIEKHARPTPRFCDGILFRQGQAPVALYLIKNGEVALGMESEGRLVMCVRAGPGSLIGLPAVVGNEPYSMTAAPCAGAEILEISSAEFRESIGKDPVLAMKALQVLAAEVRLARRSYLELIV